MVTMNEKNAHYWFYMKDSLFGENKEGPIDERTFVKLAKQGGLSKSTQVLSPTRTKNQWLTVGHIPALAAKVKEGQINREKEKNRGKGA